MGAYTRNRTKRLRTQIRGVSAEMSVFGLKNTRGEGFGEYFACLTRHIMRTYHKGAKMFKRTIELNVVKKSKKSETDSNEHELTIQDYSAAARKILNGGSVRIMKMVAAYVALDTARKIAVSRLSK